MPNTCRCNPQRPAHTQPLCNECAQQRVSPCETCGTPTWWTDLIQMQHTDGSLSNHCAPCAEWREVGE